jgi:hypothetical protein
MASVIIEPAMRTIFSVVYHGECLKAVFSKGKTAFLYPSILFSSMDIGLSWEDERKGLNMLVTLHVDAPSSR